MATDLKSPRHEQFVERQIARATRRIHALDVGRTALWLLAATLSFALAMAVLDVTLKHYQGAWAVAIQWARLGIWGVYLAGSGVLVGVLVVRLFRRINPYYAARQIEERLPNSKNSVVNWLDLREEKLPPAIKTALGLRAAHDLKDADPEQVSAGKHSWLLMAFTLFLVLGLAVLLVQSGPEQFVSLMRRAFLPIDRTAVPSPTEITLTQPKGDAVIAPRESIVFRATISGVVPRADSPQAPRLHYRYQDRDSWATLPLLQDLDGSWAVTMHSDLVQNGFFYKLSAADTETPAYEVKVVSLPQAKKFEVKYHFQPYLRLPDIATVVLSPRIKAHRGTEVTLVVHANHPLREGMVELHPDGEPVQSITGEINPGDPNAYQVKFLLEKSGSLRVLFTSTAGEENSDRSPYPVQALPDVGPSVVLTKPGKDVSLPANGTLQLEGAANDDFGVKNLILRLKIVHGQDAMDLAPKPYRPGVTLQFADGSYPDYLEYKDFVALDQLKSPRGELVPLAKGTVVAYWLEAIDNSEFPSKTGNVGKSNIYHVTIVDPQDEKKQQEERGQAGQAQQRHEKDQDQDLKQQEQDRKENRQRTPEERREERDFREKKDRLQEEIKKQEQKEQGNGKEAGDAAAEQTTMKDVDDLKNKLKQNGPEASDAAEKLENAAEKAKDPMVRQAAEKALKDNGLDPQPPAKDLTPKDVEELKDKLKKPGPQADAAERKLSKAAEQAKDPKTQEAAKDALKDAIKNLSEKDIENLKEKMKQNGAQADQAEDKLSKAAEQAGDQKAREAAKDALKDAIKNLTEKDIENLKEKLKQKGSQADRAEDKLSRAAEEAKDPQAREAAEQALKDLVKNLNEKDIKDLKDKLKQDGPKADAAERKLAKAAEAAKDEKARDAAAAALKDAIKNLTEKDIENLKEKMKQHGADADAAEKKLGKAADQAGDEKARNAAEKALKDAIKNLSQKDIEDLQEKLKQNGPQSDAAEDKLSKAAEGAGDTKVREAADRALKAARQGRELSQRDMDNLKEKLKQKGPAGDAAARELAKAAEQAKDPGTRKAIEDALKESGHERALSGSEPDLKDIEKLNKALEQKGAAENAAARELAKAAQQSKDPAVKKAAEDALKQAGLDKNAAKELGAKDIEKLKQQAKGKGPLGDAAARELGKAAENANDPAAKKAALDALKELKRDPQASKEPTQQDVRDLKDMLKQKGQGAEDAARALAKAAEDAKDPAVKKAAEDALKEKGRDPQTAQQPTKDDVNQLKEMLDKKGLLGEVAAKELKKLATLAKDPEVRQAAEDALKNAPAQNTERTPDDVEFLKHLLEQKGPLADFARRELGKIAEKGKDPSVQKLAKEALRSNSPAGADPSASQRSGVLQLDKVTPEILKNAGISEKEWQQLRKQEEARRAQQEAAGKDDPLTKKGDPGQLPSVGPQLVNPSANPTLTPTQSGRGQPPPGFRELYQRWTTRQPAPAESR